MKKLVSLFTLFVSISSLEAALPSNYTPEGSMGLGMAGMNAPQSLVINNRILLRVNGKPITVLDVVKKMDLLFYKQYPDLASNVVARYQFYQASWKPIFAAAIDDQLILADASEKEIEVTDGDVREELERLFGPTVVLNVDKLGFTYDEAFDLIKNELLVRKMNGMLVHSKALTEIVPKEVKKQYEAYLKAHPPEEKWLYRVLSIRSKDEEKSKTVAQKAYELLKGQQAAIDSLSSSLKEEGVNIVLSDKYERTEKELSVAYKAVLQTLSVGGFSVPALQTKDGETIARIFVLENRSQSIASPLREMEDQISRELTQKAVERHGLAYVAKLREHYGITDTYLSQMVPEDFEPFTLR